MRENQSVAKAGIFFSRTRVYCAFVDHQSVGSSVRGLEEQPYSFDSFEALAAGTTDPDFDDGIRSLLEIEKPLDAVVVFHPELVSTYFTRVVGAADEANRIEQYRREASLLFSGDVSYFPVPDEDHGQLNAQTMVTLVPTEMKDALAGLIEPVAESISYFSTLKAACNIISNADALRADGRPTLVLGQFEDVIEMAILDDGAIRHGYAVSASSPRDYVYWVAALITQLSLSPSDLGRVALYGNSLDPDFEDYLGRTVPTEISVIDPFDLTGLATEDLQLPRDRSAYVPSIGAAL